MLSRGLATVLVATVVLLVASAVFASSSLSKGVLLTMLPFASALAIASLGQTLATWSVVVPGRTSSSPLPAGTPSFATFA